MSDFRQPRHPERERMTGMSDAHLPESLAEIRDEFLDLPEADRLQLLLEY